MRKRHYIIAAGLTAALALSLAACGQSNSAPQTTTAGTAETTSAAPAGRAASADIYDMTKVRIDAAEQIDSYQGDYKPFKTDDENAPVVYYTKDISAEGLVKVYEAMGWEPQGKVGVKISTGEPPKSNYLRPELIGDLVKKLDGTIVECNVAYGTARASAAMHKQVAKDHGFLDIADFDVLDEEGGMHIPIENGKHMEYDIVGTHFPNYDSYLVLSHFKGHMMGGFGGALKNLSIGFATGYGETETGKGLIHSGGTRSDNEFMSDDNIFMEFAFGDNAYENQTNFTECMAEAAKGVCDYMGNQKGIAFVNVMNRISLSCDCDGNPPEPDMHDVGIFASLDPIAIDQACVDVIYTHKDEEGDTAADLIEQIDDMQGVHTIEHAAEIGLGEGTRNYRLVCID